MSLVTIFPMSGPNRFNSAAYHYPKPFIEIGNSTMVGQAIKCYEEVSGNFHFAVNKRDVVENRLDLVIKNSVSKVPFSITEVTAETSGALATCMLVTAGYPAESELIIANYDQAIDFSIQEVVRYFRSEKADFGCITFDSSHPKWSFVEVDDEGCVIRAAEKTPISRDAMVGFYYFKRLEDFVHASEKVILNAPRSSTNFYVSEAFNQLILSGKLGRRFKITPEQYVKFNEPTALENFNAKRFDAKKQMSLLLTFIRNMPVDPVEQLFSYEVLVSGGKINGLYENSEMPGILRRVFPSSLDFNVESYIAEGGQAVAFLRESGGRSERRSIIRAVYDDQCLIKQIEISLI